MIAFWGAFVRDGSPAAFGQPSWNSFGSRLLMSLRPGGESHEVFSGAFAAEHNCAFWNTVGQSAEGVPGMGVFRRAHHARAWARWLLSRLGE
jgi:para-nitrobenzyl esterase